MDRKRKAAADVFLEQQAVQQQSAEAGVDVGAAPQPPAAMGAALPASLAAGAGLFRAKAAPVRVEGLKTSEELQLEKEPIRVRETGVWPFKRVVVPPNVYVVHTRLGRSAPVTIGLGLSFRFNPQTDAYLVVPAAMQTIGVVAYCISQEKQGINVLAYVQWQIQDFAVAYQRLDFSDTRDPLGIVNAQLREQAEAAIKDKIATMSVEEVLTDKQPVIEELTARLKAVAEGRSAGDHAAGEGLGIKIVTVQIKEALVSSQRLWEHLQAPFRYEQEKYARISFLAAQEEVRERELQTRRIGETREAETLVDIERITQAKQTEGLAIRLAEERTRLTEEQEMARHRKTVDVERAIQAMAEETRLATSRLESERLRIARETELKRIESELGLFAAEQDAAIEAARLDAELGRRRAESASRLELEEAANRVRVALARDEAEVRNLASEADLSGRLIERLPEIASKLPQPDELRILQTGADAGGLDAIAAFVARVMALADSIRGPRPEPPSPES